MRLPTPRAELYFWHTEALAGRKPATTEDAQAGWFVRRMEAKSALLPASIYWEQIVDPDTGELIADEVMKCEVCGIPRDPHEEWLWLATRVISEAEYMKLMAEVFAADEYKGPQRTRARWIEDAEKEARNEQVRFHR